MASEVVGKALSYVGGKLLDYFKDNVLKDWAASNQLGPNVRALERELEAVKAVLEHIVGKEIHNSQLKKLLDKLQDLGYDADDVLDELDYFRIQGELDGTFHAADQHARGWAHNLALNVSHTATATAGKLICLPASMSASASRACCDTVIHAVGKCFPCSPLLPLLRDEDEETSDNGMQHNSPERYHTNEPPKLEFDRVGASKKMILIVNEMKELRQRISEIITTLGSQWITVPNNAQSHRISTSESIEPTLYGRDLMMNSIIDDIKGKYSSEVLTVIPIIGPGGIGKTTLAQHIYQSEKLQQHFGLKVWICVPLNFDVSKLMQEIEKKIPKVAGESSNHTNSELIGQRLIKGRKLLLVLDDIWNCSNEDQWKQLLLPFKKSQERGNIILATTRFPKQAQIMTQKTEHSVYLQGLESEEFEKLFLDIVFGDDDQSRKDHKFLFDIGFKIAGKLKGSPLAAKTVGRLLKTQLDWVHWTRVLESKEWEQSYNENDIMPALKLSFDYLPSHQLKQCLSYCSLFPQDYKLKEDDLINFLIGEEVVHSSCGENKTVEDIVQNHLTKLVDYCFLETKQEKDGGTCYNIHDLLHELVRKVSSHECLIIDSAQSPVRSLQVLPSSIRHLSINIEDSSVNDRLTLKTCVEDFNTLLRRIKVEKLRTIMLFGDHHGCFVKAFGDLFREAKALRVVFLSGASYDVNDLLHNFYYLIHLRYLRIESSYPYKPINRISRFYHMKVLDADIIDNLLPRDITNLVKLRHLLVPNDTIHSSIIDVGKLKSLQELRRFVVKQDEQGFELRQIGHLEGLCGSLCIDNLENVEGPEEAYEAKMMLKSHLQELILRWNKRQWYDSALEERVLEKLKPSRNLRKLSIIGHTGGTCPSWLGMNLSLSSLESLCLDDVNWETFPPIGDLLLVNVPLEKISAKIPEKRFGNLRRLQLEHLSRLKTWAVHAPCQLFPYLEVLIIRDCSELEELSFSHSASCCQQGKDANPFLFSRLSKLEIKSCPQLSSFPPIPWTEALHSISIEGTSSIHRLHCETENSYQYSLTIVGKKDTTDSAFWNVLDFHKLTGLTELSMDSCESPPLHYLQMLSSLRILRMSCLRNTFPFIEVDGHVKYQFPVEVLFIKQWNLTGKELTQLLTYFPKLLDLWLSKLEKLTGLGVNVQGQRATETPGPSSSSSTNKVELQQDAGANNNIIVASEEAERGLLLLPPQLQKLSIGKLSVLRFEAVGGLQGLTSLRVLEIWLCPELLSSYSSSSFSSSFPFPNSLEHLDIWKAGRSMDTLLLVPLSNLTSLTKLRIRGTPNLFVDSEQSWVHEQELPFSSSKLQELAIDDVAGFTAASIRHSLIFSTLTELMIHMDDEVERLMEEQEAFLFVDSLVKIRFNCCDNLQCLPARLHTLTNLKRLHIDLCKVLQVLPNDVLPSSLQELVIENCPKILSLPKISFPSSLRKLEITSCQAIQMLPEDALPSSLQELEIDDCPAIQSLPKDCLPDSLQKLEIRNCRAIRSLPEVDDLPSSLRELDVRDSRSKVLRSQCRRFINIIPIVRA